MVSSTEETIEVLTAWQVRKSPVHVEVADAGIKMSFDGFVSGVNIGALELRNMGCHLVLMLMPVPSNMRAKRHSAPEKETT